MNVEEKNLPQNEQLHEKCKTAGVFLSIQFDQDCMNTFFTLKKRNYKNKQTNKNLYILYQ